MNEMNLLETHINEVRYFGEDVKVLRIFYYCIDMSLQQIHLIHYQDILFNKDNGYLLSAPPPPKVS